MTVEILKPAFLSLTAYFYPSDRDFCQKKCLGCFDRMGNCSEKVRSPGGCKNPPGCVKNAQKVAMQGFIADKYLARPPVTVWLACRCKGDGSGSLSGSA